jgi:hypothetical protein
MQPGVYEGAVADQFEPVVPPQINGVKTDTHWAALTDGTAGLLVYGDTTMAFANVSTADHLGALRRGDSVSVTLDRALMGVGTKFHAPVESSLVPPDSVRFEVVFRPFDPSEERPADLARRHFSGPDGVQ